MIVWLLHNWKGFVRLRLRGYSPERFLNLCNARGLELWGIECNPDGDYEFYMTVKGCRQVRPLVRKSRVRLKVIGRFGLPFFIERNKKRWYYGAGFGSFFLLLYILSLFIWDIQFEGNYRYTYDTLIGYLETQDIGYGMLKSKIGCEELEASIRTDFPEITWVSARVSGTRLLIQLKENEVLSAIPEKDDTPRNVIASKKGTITSMIVRQGIGKALVGDTVEKGQVLISGRVPIIGDNEEEIRADLVPADGDIYAKTEYTYEKTVPKIRTVRVPTGRNRPGFYLKAGPWSYTFLCPAPGSRQWDYTMEEKQLKLFSNFYLPVYAGKIRGREMITYEQNYSDTELKALAEAVNRQFVKKLEQKGVQILENNDRIEESVSEYRLVGRLLTEESIVSIGPVEEIISDSEETKTAE